MKKFKLNIKDNKLIAIGAVVGGLVIGFFVYDFINSFSQITQAKADNACQEFFQDVKSQITSIASYKIIGGTKNCNAEKDETGSTDYTLSVNFRVSKDGSNSVSAIRSDINYLSDKLPRKGYPIWVDNIPARNGQPATICITAQRYLNNDGKYIKQGSNDHHPRYTEPGSIEGFAPCRDLWTVSSYCVLIRKGSLELYLWRRGRDSNPRGRLLPPINLANWPLEPLGYLSIFAHH